MNSIINSITKPRTCLQPLCSFSFSRLQLSLLARVTGSFGGQVARLEYKQRSANYAAAQLAPEAVAARRAFSARLHSHHQRSLLDVNAAPTTPSSSNPSASNSATQSVEAVLSGIEGLTFVEEEDSDDDDDKSDDDDNDEYGLRQSAVLDLDAHISFTDNGAVKRGNQDTSTSVSAAEAAASLEVNGFGAAWRHFTGPACNCMTAHMLRDDPIAVAQAGFKQITDQVRVRRAIKRRTAFTLNACSSCNTKFGTALILIMFFFKILLLLGPLIGLC